jgi:hypothetical protein
MMTTTSLFLFSQPQKHDHPPIDSFSDTHRPSSTMVKQSWSLLLCLWLSCVSSFTTLSSRPAALTRSSTSSRTSPVVAVVVVDPKDTTIRLWSSGSDSTDKVSGSDAKDDDNDNSDTTPPLPPDAPLKALLETPEIMALLQSDKMQEDMQLVISGRQEELHARVQEDSEFQEIVEKLSEIMSGVDGDGGGPLKL